MKNFFIFLCLIIIFAVQTVHAKDRVILEADNVTSTDNNTIRATGNVLIIYDNIILTAEKVVYKKDKNFAKAWDNVTLKENNNVLHASYLEIDLNTKKGTIENGSGFYEPYYYFTAKQIDKIGENNYVLHDSRMSSCSGEVPDWSIKTSSAKIDYGEYFRTKHATFNIKNFPILYSPYFIWPIRTERKSGFLVPSFGYGSDTGTFFTPKYFWNIDVDKDLTVGTNLYSDRGIQFLSEFRYNKSKREDIYLYGEYINDSAPEANKTKRWKIVNKSNIYLTDDIELRFNTDYVSDFRYKRDFNDFTMTENDEDINDDSENSYINEIRLNIYKPYTNLYIRYRDEMEFYDRENGYSKSHLIRAPEIILEKNSIDAKLLYLDYHLDYNKLKKSNRNYIDENNGGTATTSTLERNHGYIRFYKPLQMKILTFTPHYKQYFTRWYNYNHNFNVDEYYDKEWERLSSDEDEITRSIYEIGYKISFNEIYRNYKYFRHSIYNTLSYTQTPYMDQSGIPNLIEDDIIEEQKLYEYTITNYFNADAWDIKQSFKQGYDVALDDEHFVPLETELDFNYRSLITANFENHYDYYKGRSDYMDNRLILDFKYFYFKTELVYDRENLDTDYLSSLSDKEYNTSLKSTVGVRWDPYEVEFSHESYKYMDEFKYNFNDFTTEEYSVTALYNSDCWSLGLTYSEQKYDKITEDGIKTDDEKKIFAVFRLKGLGETEREIFNRQ